MKNLLLSTIFFAGIHGVFAQNGLIPATDANAPVMSFTKDAIDYGSVKQDADGNRIFSFTNTGKTALVISEAHGSCKCTVPAYPKEPIMPGQKAEIKVHYDTHTVGPFSKSITVNSNAKNSPIILRISGTVETPSTEPAITAPAKEISIPVENKPSVKPVPAKKTAASTKETK